MPLRRFLAVALTLLVVCALAYLTTGTYDELGAVETLHALLGLVGLTDPDPGIDMIVNGIRLPRLLVAIFAGASLSAAGGVMQAVFRNPLASPEILGTAAGSALGGAAAIVLGVATLSVFAVPVYSFAGALAVTLAVFVLAGSGGRFSVTALLLAGIAVNTLVGSLTSFLVTIHFKSFEASSEVLFWLMGGLESRTWDHAWITGGGLVLFGAALVPLLRDMDVLTLHDETAASLGIDVPRLRKSLLLLACGLTAATVANTGGITFIGLVVPHLARLLVGPSHRMLLPSAMVLGALILVIADLLCRVVPSEANLRLGVVTSILGAPYFLYLLARHRRGEAL